MRTACFSSDERTKMEICCDEGEDRGLVSSQDDLQLAAKSLAFENEGNMQPCVKYEKCCEREHFNCRCQPVQQESEMPLKVDNNCSTNLNRETLCDGECNVLQNTFVSSQSPSIQTQPAVMDDVDNSRAATEVDSVKDAIITDQEGVNAFCLPAVENTQDSSGNISISDGLNIDEHFSDAAGQVQSDSALKMNANESGSGSIGDVNVTQSVSFVESSAASVDGEASVRVSVGDTLPDVPLGITSKNWLESTSVIDGVAVTTVPYAVENQVTCTDVTCPEGADLTSACDGMSVKVAVDDSVMSSRVQGFVMEESAVQVPNTPVIKLDDKCDDSTLHALQGANDEEAGRKSSRVRFHEHHVVTSYLEPPSPWRDG